MLGFAAAVLGERVTGVGALSQLALWAGREPSDEWRVMAAAVFLAWGAGMTVAALAAGRGGWKLGQPPPDDGDVGLF